VLDPSTHSPQKHPASALHTYISSSSVWEQRETHSVALQVEFPVSHDALLPVGTMLNASHFVPGQHVDITAVTKGKGFAGGMKKWGFKGQGRSHGHSLSHRSVGSIGAQGYARVLPGKKMPGKMGARRRVQLNCWVYRCV
jgi:large subunit ribosomal protein L3